MAPKKQASVKPEGMSDYAWKVFMAHKGGETEVGSTPTLGEDGKVNYLIPVNLAELASQFLKARNKRPSLLAEDYTESRKARIKRKKEGE